MFDFGSPSSPLSASMFGVCISLPKQLMSLKPMSSASMMIMLGLLVVLILVAVIDVRERAINLLLSVSSIVTVNKRYLLVTRG